MTLLCQCCILAPQLIEVIPEAAELLLLVQKLVILALDDIVAALQPAGSNTSQLHISMTCFSSSTASTVSAALPSSTCVSTLYCVRTSLLC
jgi:hypothetical protein